MQVDQPRKTHIMTIGQTDQQWREWKTNMKGALQSMHMGWSFGSEKADSAADAVSRVNDRENLEIVFFSNENFQGSTQLISDAEVIADALSKHQRSPWVVLSSGLEYLYPVFRKFGVEVRTITMLQFIIHDRWESKIKPSAIV